MRYILIMSNQPQYGLFLHSKNVDHLVEVFPSEKEATAYGDSERVVPGFTHLKWNDVYWETYPDGRFYRKPEGESAHMAFYKFVQASNNLTPEESDNRTCLSQRDM